LARRVVVTGLGLICGVGNTSSEVWKSIVEGKSGVGKITHFDASSHACQIAAEVKNFDPLNFIEKKEVKKMGRFIHLAMAATDEAMKMSGLPVTPENALMPIKPSGRAEFIHMVEGVMFLTNPGVSGDVRSYALTHRTGRTDIAWTIGRLFNELTRNELRMVWSVRFEEGLTDAVLSSVQRLQNFGIEGPWAVFVTLLGIKGYQLNQNDRIVSDPAWRDRLTLPDLLAGRLDAEALLPLFRSFWLCFGVPRPDGTNSLPA